MTESAQGTARTAPHSVRSHPGRRLLRLSSRSRGTATRSPAVLESTPEKKLVWSGGAELTSHAPSVANMGQRTLQTHASTSGGTSAMA